MRRMFSKNQIEEIAANKAKDVIESGGVDNAKPIYYHPIYIASEQGSGVVESRMSCAILNNDPTPFTASTFLAYVKDLLDKGASIQINGYFKTNDAICNAYIMFYTTENYRIYGNSTTDRANITLAQLGESFTLSDGVNKIN